MSNNFLWWRDGVIYQIYPRSFADSNGDGLGDLAGLITRLDYLNGRPDSLGVDAIWLSPIYPSPAYDFGYDVADYENIDPLFGSLEEFDCLIAEAHKRGIRVVLDLVMNHTSHLHPWFIEARSSRNNPKRDWYIWRDAVPDGPEPNNWEAVFGGKAWEWDARTCQYYYHKFLKEQPDLNWRNPEVRARLFAMMKFWLARGVDGFRLDVVNAFFKDAHFRDNPPALGLRGYERQKHVYDLDQPEMEELLRALRQFLDAYPERMAVGEVMGDSPKLAARYCGPGQDLLHLAFNFEFTHQPWLPRPFQQAIQNWEAALPPGAWPCYVLSNHDVDRHVTRFGGGRYSDARAKVAAALLLTQRGTPFLYYGEELGLSNTPIPRAEIQDPPGKRYWPLYPGRDAERTPMPWNTGLNAGFTTGRPWLRLNADYRTRNVDAQQSEPNSVFNFYRQLLALRRASPALQRGVFRPMLHRPVTALIYQRRCPEQAMLVALNFFGWETNVEVDELLAGAPWRLRLSSAPGDHARVHGNRVRLAPFEACALEAE